MTTAHSGRNSANINISWFVISPFVIPPRKFTRSFILFCAHLQPSANSMVVNADIELDICLEE